MKNSIRKRKVTQFNASRGIEREIALKKGDIWIRPTTCMELKTMYNRNRQKKETRQMVLEYEEVKHDQSNCIKAGNYRKYEYCS